jgi:hypothetical protein
LSTEIENKFEGVQRIVPQEEADLVRDILNEFSQMTVWRNNLASQCEEVASLIDPVSKNTFFYGTVNWPGQKKTQEQVDASGMMALQRFGAICNSMLTPRNMRWHMLRANNDYVMKDRGTKLWFEEVTEILFKYRYEPTSGFSGSNLANWRSVGAYGNASMFIDALDARQFKGARGLRYKGVPFGETFFRENHQGIVDGFVRWFKLTAYQAAQKWGLARLPAGLQTALKANSQWGYDFIHCVRPRKDYDPERLDSKGKPYGSYYVSIEGQCLMAPEGGYRSLPLAVSRYDQAPIRRPARPMAAARR